MDSLRRFLQKIPSLPTFDSLRNQRAAFANPSGIDGLKELQFEAALKRSIAARRPVILQEEFPLHAAASPEKA